MSQFKNKVIVITGGSEGIGRALVDIFLQQGAKVATCSRNFDKLYHLQTQYPDMPLLTHTADISKENECNSFIQKVIKIYGSIDVLINNAGISMRALFVDTELETLRKLMDVNFWGAVYCTKFALPFLIQNQGVVVGVSSIAGFRGLPGRSGYSASKFALNGWLESIRTELVETGVSVVTVCPGFTSSNIRKVALNKDAKPEAESLMKEEKMMSAEQCAQHIFEAIEKRKRTLILTTQGKEAVYLNRFLPALADKLIRKFYFNNNELIK
ncbi:MAG TPA: SDR family oxidoreductase [Arachidicoccus soli]|uniref:SDR family oxidoreductase n=1 Tax=Arachidicoccus soli TaxID=2341117 RepID=A0A386HMK2_9BACT|nr:SDR family oxidoreductase [Arachidicoccus soli]AYD47128.1 SDR family oxidoreductase [Arachidicoccus soli]HEU0227199.1 SDR family oxidoreductase [Arachidicoccus soli]